MSDAPSEPVTVRKASLRDTTAITRFARLLAAAHGDPTDIVDDTAVARDMLGDGSPMTVLIAEVDGTAAGYAALLPAYETSYAAAGSYVSDLFVDDAFRGRGVGRRLLAAAARRVRERGGSYLWLTMMAFNATADRFYRGIADVRDEVVAFAVTRDAFQSLADAAGNTEAEPAQPAGEAGSRALVARFLAALNAGDQETALACLDEDVAHDPNQSEREIGKEAYRWHLGLKTKHFREDYGDIAIMMGEGGGKVAVELTIRGKYLASADGFPPANGQSYALPAGLFLEIDDGLISRVSWHFNRSDWIAQLERS